MREGAFRGMREDAAVDADVAGGGSRRGPLALFAAALTLTLLPAVLPRTLSGGVGWTLRISAALGGIAAAVALYRRARPPVAPVLAAFLGAAAAGVGMGDAGMHLLKQRFSWSAYTTLPSLVAGVILFLLGIGILLMRTRGWRKVLALVVAGASLWYVAAPLMIAAYVTHVPDTPLSGLTPADKDLVYRNVAFTTRDGVELEGWYVPSRNRAAVIVIHGSGSNRSTMIDHLTLLARRGYGVLAYDSRGHGESSGTAMDFGWLGYRDLDAALAFLSRQPDVDAQRIGTFGVSKGAVEALTTAASDRRIRSVVSDGANIASVGDALTLGPSGWLRLPFDWVTITAADLMSPAEPPIPLVEAVRRISPRPVLLISGKGRTESELNRRYLAAAPATTELWELPGTKHVRGIWDHPREWASRVGRFFDRTLLG